MIRLTINQRSYGKNELNKEIFLINYETIKWLGKEGEIKKESNIDPNEGILDIVGKVGFDIPYACRAGACFSCACKIKNGGETLDQEKFGTKLIDTPEDEFLTCIGGIKDFHLKDEKEYNLEMEVVNG